MNNKIKSVGSFITAILFLMAASAVNADDMVEKGKKDIKKCTTCHALEDGKKKIGPTLFNIIGRPAGSQDGYKYSTSYIEAGKNGLVWDKDQLTDYLGDPKGFLKSYLKVDKVKTKMLLKIKKLETRQNIIAFLESLQK